MAKKDQTIEEKLNALYSLQKIDAKIDEIHVLKGELPMEVKDLEDEIAGLETRIGKIEEEKNELNEQITNNANAAKDAEALILKYEQQQQNVKNNREYDALSKEIELQKLEIQLCEKKTKDAKEAIEAKEAFLKESQDGIEDKKKELEDKKKELEKIIAETDKEEADLKKKAEKSRESIEERLLVAYDKIRASYRNGLAVAPIERDSCGGCFNKVPPQKQLEIRQAQKINLCDHCGRVLVFDSKLAEQELIAEEEKKEAKKAATKARKKKTAKKKEAAK